jgi:hypothetical protein
MIMFVGKNVRSNDSWIIWSGSRRKRKRKRKRLRMMRERGGEESGERFR